MFTAAFDHGAPLLFQSGPAAIAAAALALLFQL
jgi:hypothetical protein